MSHWLPAASATFVALDFETADRHSDSACAIGLARVQDGEVVQVLHRHIRPPRNSFEHSWVHGITWEHVREAPTFGELWPEIEAFLQDCEFLVAHNAGFERRVLTTCLGALGKALPSQPIHCTVQLAKRTWPIPKHNLPSVCAHLGITLRHHDAASDAEACARIVLAAARQAEAPQ